MPTIHDVARLANVSAASVSLVVNDHNTSRVSASRRRQILRIAEELGYAPNGMARALNQGSTRIIGLIVPMRDPIFFNYFIAEILSGIQACLIEHGYHLMIYSHGVDTGRITRSVIMQSRYVDGLIVVNTRMCSKEDIVATTEELERAGIPFVMTNSYLGQQSVNYVGVDDVEVGRIAGAYLVKQGHKSMALLNGSMRSPMGQSLLAGFRDALKSKRVRFNPNFHAYSEYDSEHIKDTVQRWLSVPNRPTAIFCSDDQIVPDVYSVIHSKRMRVPKDVAVLGRGNLTLAAHLTPKLTTITIPAFHIGKRASELLIGGLKEKGAPSQKILLPCTVVEGKSA
jgi:DNA-binding LacI/PurR family transcriptional regulator